MPNGTDAGRRVDRSRPAHDGQHDPVLGAASCPCGCSSPSGGCAPRPRRSSTSGGGPGAEVRAFLDGERRNALPFVRPLMDGVLHADARWIAAAVVLAEVLIALALLTGWCLRAGLWAGVALNVGVRRLRSGQPVGVLPRDGAGAADDARRASAGRAAPQRGCRSRCSRSSARRRCCRSSAAFARPRWSPIRRRCSRSSAILAAVDRLIRWSAHAPSRRLVRRRHPAGGRDRRLGGRRSAGCRPRRRAALPDVTDRSAWLAAGDERAR